MQYNNSKLKMQLSYINIIDTSTLNFIKLHDTWRYPTTGFANLLKD